MVTVIPVDAEPIVKAFVAPLNAYNVAVLSFPYVGVTVGGSNDTEPVIEVSEIVPAGVYDAPVTLCVSVAAEPVNVNPGNVIVPLAVVVPISVLAAAYDGVNVADIVAVDHVES